MYRVIREVANIPPYFIRWIIIPTGVLKMYEGIIDSTVVQVKQRALDAKQALNLLYLLNDGGDIQNMLDRGNYSLILVSSRAILM